MDELIQIIFNNPEIEVNQLSYRIKQAIMVNHPDIEEEVDEDALYVVGRNLTYKVSCQIIDILGPALQPGFSNEDIINYMNLVERMRAVRFCAQRVADFIADYNNWKREF